MTYATTESLKRRCFRYRIVWAIWALAFLVIAKYLGPYDKGVEPHAKHYARPFVTTGNEEAVSASCSGNCASQQAGYAWAGDFGINSPDTCSALSSDPDFQAGCTAYIKTAKSGDPLDGSAPSELPSPYAESLSPTPAAHPSYRGDAPDAPNLDFTPVPHE